MVTIERHHGIAVELPEGMAVSGMDAGSAAAASFRGRRASGGPIPMPMADAGGAPGDELARAMIEQGMTLIDSFELSVTSTTGTTRGRRSGHGRVTVELAGHEDAVLLLEQDGVYGWRYASDDATLRTPARRRGPLLVPGRKRLVFELALAPGPVPPGRRRSLVDELAGAGLRAWVLKFAARHAVASAIRVLERHVRHRLVHISSADLDSWKPVATAGELQVPEGRAARILLLVHGTFSSTAGSFHALAATDWGQAFLGSAVRQYDLVLGFDHPTLGHDPAENAAELLALLEQMTGAASHSIDVIGFSRGCMVARSLAELLLPASDSGPRVRRIVLVGGTNLGTRLAEPKNWECLADLYTNLAVDACRVLQLFPAAAPAATMVKESLASIGALVKYIAVAALEERIAPGLAALAPGGEFAARLNGGQPASGFESFYYLVSSEFDAALAGRDDALPARLVNWLLDMAADKFIGCSNDLVVDLASMSLSSPKPGVFVQGRLDFCANPNIHHTAYFIRPELTRAMTRWLDLEPPHSGTGYAHDDWPGWSITEKKIRVLPADTPLSALPRRNAADAPDYLVLARRTDNGVDYHVRHLPAVVRIVERLPPTDRARSLQDALADSALALHPGHPSPVLRRGAPLPSAIAPGEMFVLMEGEAPVAVAWPPGRAPLARLRELMSADETRYRGAERRKAPRERASEADRKRGGARPQASARPHDRYYFGASMKENIGQGRTETVRVTVSRDRLQQQPGAASALFDTDLPSSRAGTREAKLIIQLIPKTNLEIVGDDRFELAPQSVQSQVELVFDVRGTDPGEGELWVLVRHGPLRLAMLSLKTRIAQSPPADAPRGSAAASSMMEDMPEAELPVLQIFERRNGGNDSYLFALDLGDGNYLTADSAPIRNDRQAYVSAIYAEIEARWLASPGDFAAFNDELRAFGGTLFDQLIPVPIQRALWPIRDKLRAIHVLSEEPFIPWELVHLKPPPEDGQPQPLPSDSHFLGQKGLVRWLHNYRNAPRRISVRHGHVFHSIPDYPHPDYRLPAAQEEIAFLEAGLGSRWAGADSASLRELLRDAGKVDLFHFSGHGEAETRKAYAARILLEGRVEGKQYLPDFLRSDVIEQHARLCGDSGSRPIVVLNACQIGRAGWHLTSIGGFAEAFLRAGAGVFVGTLWAVGDKPAQKFTEAFYTALKSGQCLADAVIAAREGAREAGEATWLAYAVYGHPHATVLFEK